MAAGTSKRLNYALLIIGLIRVLTPAPVNAQAGFKDFANLFNMPAHYVVSYTGQPPVIDGDLSDKAWDKALWTTNFRDIEGDKKPVPPLQTNVKMLWDDSCLYIAAKLQEPQVWATMKQHDAIIFNDNDFEIFIDPYNTTHRYFEMEVNALNTVFDLFLNKPYRNGGSAMINLNAEGMRSAVKVQGTLNNPADGDKGWTVELAIPFKAISLGNGVNVPVEGSLWRINFSRVEWDTRAIGTKNIKLKNGAGHNLPEHNWVWSAQGVIDMHYPERWGYLSFTKKGDTAFSMPYAELQKQYLWLVYYKQQQWLKEHGSYAPSLSILKVDGTAMVSGEHNKLEIEATPHQFFAIITDTATRAAYTINQEGLVQKLIRK